MKFLEKLSLKIFSIIIGTLSVVVALIVLGIIDVSIFEDCIKILIDTDLNIKITIVVSAILLLLSLDCFFFGSKKENSGKEGIILENSNGKLVISRESLENMISSVSKEIPGTESISSKTVLDKERNLKVFVTIVANRDVMLKDISTQLQTKIKDAMKKTADLEVKEVNIRVKNITSKKSKNINNNISVVDTDMNNNIKVEDTKDESIEEEEIKEE